MPCLASLVLCHYKRIQSQTYTNFTPKKPTILSPTSFAFRSKTLSTQMEKEVKSSNTRTQSLSVELGPVLPAGKDEPNHELAPTSAHTIGNDPWQQVGLMLVTGFNCGYILSFSNLILRPLGWTWGLISMILVGLFISYSNWLLAAFHYINGQRFIGYRDLMGFVFGRKMYYITWVLQFLTLVLINMGFILLGGRALKEMNSEFSSSPLRLQYFLAVTGAAYFLFAFFIPTMSAMRRWLAASIILTVTYIAILLVVLVKDGKSNRDQDYDIRGSKVSKMFNGFGAIAAVIVCNTSGLLPEIQSTLQKPAVANMRKALSLQYTVGLVVYYGVTAVGYWAYGSVVSEYLPRELGGAKWVKVLINAIVFLQSVISQHVFVAPIHEALDTKFLKLEESMFSKGNIKLRFFLRALFFALNTLVTAAFPFMGDFVNLFGSFTLIPLTFVFPSMIFIKVKGKTCRTENKMWHWCNIVFFSLLTVATTISAVRQIVNNVQQYSFFADT